MQKKMETYQNVKKKKSVIKCENKREANRISIKKNWNSRLKLQILKSIGILLKWKKMNDCFGFGCHTAFIDYQKKKGVSLKSDQVFLSYKFRTIFQVLFLCNS